ncbi:hypothetical protein HZB01_01225 [Candidatus Woesearchaeota archaeon]|nr:hypothetical protein [Candidatus Woesearchaeota archaeon]
MAAKQTANNPLYIGISDPLTVRRALLETSKEAISYLQRFEEFKKVRTEKLAFISEYHTTIHDLQKQMAKLRSLMPNTSLHATMPEPKHKVKVKQQAVEQPEIDRLKQELSRIESQLSRMA